MNNFWQKLNRPIIALAPMAGITDAGFRYLCGKCGADVVYSEMVSATAMVHGSEKTWELMKSYKKNGGAKFVVQLFGNNPDHFAIAVKLIEKKIKPDGIDINFGCSASKIQKSGAGVKLFQDLDLAHEVIKTVIANTKLPISVKVRIKAGRVSVLDFIEKMKDLDIKAIMVHGRTLVQGFVGGVDAVMINRVKKKFKGIVLANGGVGDWQSAQKLLKDSDADGLGIGQGACGRPWIFRQLRIMDYELRIKDIFKIAYEHAKLMEKLKGKQGILEMRKHLCWYVKGMLDAAELRKKFVKVKSLNDIKKIMNNNLLFK